MARCALSGSGLRSVRGDALAAVALLGGLLLATAAAVWALDSQRRSRLEPQQAQLELLRAQTAERQARARPALPVHFQLRRLRRLARTLPGLEPLAAAPASAADAEIAGLAAFDGAVWRVEISGSIIAVADLCRRAQARLPVWISSIQSEQGRARAVALLFGAAGEEA